MRGRRERRREGGNVERGKERSEGEGEERRERGAGRCSSSCGPGGELPSPGCSAETSMGGCVGSHHDSSGSLNENSDGTGVALGRNQPLKRERPKWKRALTECYDELGNRYQLPVYCLSPPVNMIEERSDEPDGSDPDSGAADPSTGSASEAGSGGECLLRLRLSTGRDLRLVVRSTDTVGMMKRRLLNQEGVPAATQRWFFSGRPLTDRLRLDQLNISRDYVVQVILSQPPQPEPLLTPGHTPEASGPAGEEGAEQPQEPTPVEN
ncbi:hypothetical protein F7725_006897 [Dissostichus mawsoni]|uniref:Ubiquitin-like domain-containing protein n=1 Tax=Dissostichus mawsoni TaxID=36200 RepID=A0A7J5XV85_DISMA|nr:hypothetical protein F7725_006897 [Dissostichus mawsoni]